MDSSRLEDLLEQIVAQNAEIIDKLDDLIGVVREINGELDWVGDHAFAKTLVDRLDDIESAIRDTTA